jgi:hypothetical protein
MTMVRANLLTPRPEPNGRDESKRDGDRWSVGGP